MNSKVQWALILGLFLLIPVALSAGYTVSKAISYPLVGMLAVYNLATDRNSMMQVLVAFFILLIVERLYMYNLTIGLFSVKPVALFVVARLIRNAFLPNDFIRDRNKGTLLIVVLSVTATLSFLLAILSGADVRMELNALQRHFLTSMLFLLFGIQIRHSANYSQIDIQRTFALMVLGVSSLHLFANFTGINLEYIRGDGAGYKFGSYFRYGGVFGNVNVQSIFLIGGMSFALFLVADSRRKLDKLLGSMAFVMGMVSILISGSRMGLAMLPLLILIFLFIYRTRIKKLMSTMIGIAVAAMILAGYQASNILTYFNKSMARVEEAGSESGRMVLWPCVVELLPSWPLGMGLSSDLFSEEISQCIHGSVANPHNLLLDFGVHLGIVGLLFFMFYLVVIGRIFCRIACDRHRHEIVDASSFLAITMMLLYGFSEAYAFNLHKLHAFFFFIIGLGIGAGFPKRRLRSGDLYSVSPAPGPRPPATQAPAWSRTDGGRVGNPPEPPR